MVTHQRTIKTSWINHEVFIVANKVKKIDNLGYYNRGCFYIYFKYSKRFGEEK
jgi:hypothetical protein